MFIICPKCSAKYQIPDGTILQEGQKLKCSACDFVFLKGEEAPLILEQPIIQEPTVSATEAFSNPLYTQPVSENQELPIQTQTLPEAFQPVSNPAKSRTYLLFIPLYIILIIGLCMMGWHFRSSLKPSVEEIIPQAVFEKKEPKKERIVQDNQITEKELKKKKTQSTLKEVKSVISNTVQQPTVPKTTDEIKTDPMTQPDSNPSVSTPVLRQEINKLNSPKKTKQPETENTNASMVIKEPIVLPPEEDIVPLFEAISPPIPMATKSELEVTQISFKVTPNAQGIEQLLVEGILQNKSAETKSVPALTVVLLDKDNIVLNWQIGV